MVLEVNYIKTLSVIRKAFEKAIPKISTNNVFNILY